MDMLERDGTIRSTDVITTVASATTTEELAPPGVPAVRQRLDRLIGDHLLRNGLQRTAGEYAALGKVESLVDRHIFGQSSRVCEALRSSQITDALAWCADNKVALRKRKSRLEFELRKQEFIELCREARHADAIAYAQKNLSPFLEAHAVEIQQAAALLCHRSDTLSEPYRVSGRFRLPQRSFSPRSTD